MIQARDSHGCSSFWLKGNQILVVSPSSTVGVGKTVEFLDLAQENTQWIQGTIKKSKTLKIPLKTQILINFRPKFAC